MRAHPLILALLVVLCGSASAAGNDNARIEALLGKMTLEEKAGQLNQLSVECLPGPVHGADTGDELVRRGLVGSVLDANTAYETNFYQREAIEDTRLHIPLLFGLDVIHGFRTIFPVPLGLSASWDPRLVERTARFAAHEAALQGVRWTFSPMVDIARDPRWGRIVEGAGEDPYLGAAMARAYVRGYQGRKLDEPGSILACAKHFVGYGAAEGGRAYNTTEISERTLREVYLPPFRAATDAGAATVMSAFNALDGVPASANAFTLSTILKGEWRFPGFVVSDWGAVPELMLHGIANDEATAARKAFMAGVDMDMQSTLFLYHLPDLVRSGAVPRSRLDDAVRRVLRLKFALGLFDHPYVADPGSPFPPIAAEGRALARRAAEESFVLLENRPFDGARLLPLAAAPRRRIALIGPLAGSAGDMLGSWTCQGNPRDVVTLESALTEYANATGMNLVYAKGTGVAGAPDGGFAEAIAAAKNADIAVVALGEGGHDTGEASSRANLNLPGDQEALLEAVVATGTPVVLIVFSGRPLTISWAATHVPAILMAWFPGLEAGPALVRTLFGEASPSGRLTVSIPRTVGQVPIYYDALNTGRPASDPIGLGINPASERYVSGYIDEPSTPLYPFGYGLTYTSFSYSPPEVDTATVSAKAIENGARISVAADVRNTGARAGTAVAQLYIRWRGTSVARPVRELKGFRRVDLAPGASRHLVFALGRDELQFWGLDRKFEVEPGSLYVWVAGSSTGGIPVKVTVGP
ncbi:MAG: glycoside hydrolase family 3 N-terminal domain-containing protein [Opitutaceae bacterium]